MICALFCYCEHCIETPLPSLKEQGVDHANDEGDEEDGYEQDEEEDEQCQKESEQGAQIAVARQLFDWYDYQQIVKHFEK